MTKGCDFTSRSLTGATLKADGYAFCCRYVLNAPGGTLDKQMSAAEVREKSAHGIRIVSNFEWQAVPPNSRATGKEHATACKAQLRRLRAPAWAPVYYSVDTAAHADDFNAYARGWRDVYPADQLGVYGDGALFRQLKADGFVKYAWQSMSFSFPGNHNADGRTWNHAGADIIQTGNGTINGHSVDFDTATVTHYGGWLLGESDPNTPTPPPEEDMALTKEDVNLLLTTNLGSTGPNVGQALQGTFQKVSALTPGTSPSTPASLSDADVAKVAKAVVDLLNQRLES